MLRACYDRGVNMPGDEIYRLEIVDRNDLNI